MKLPVFIVTNNIMSAVSHAERLMATGFRVEGIIGLMSELMDLPDGAHLVLWRCGGQPFPTNDLMAAAQGMIRRGIFVEAVLDEW